MAKPMENGAFMVEARHRASVEGNPFVEGRNVELSPSVLGLAAPPARPFSVTIPAESAVPTDDHDRMLKPEPPESGFLRRYRRRAGGGAKFGPITSSICLQIDGVPVQTCRPTASSRRSLVLCSDPNIWAGRRRRRGALMATM
jgi:hypothetical protein